MDLINSSHLISIFTSLLLHASCHPDSVIIMLSIYRTIFCFISTSPFLRIAIYPFPHSIHPSIDIYPFLHNIIHSRLGPAIQLVPSHTILTNILLFVYKTFPHWAHGFYFETFFLRTTSSCTYDADHSHTIFFWLSPHTFSTSPFHFYDAKGF